MYARLVPLRLTPLARPDPCRPPRPVRTTRCLVDTAARQTFAFALCAGFMMMAGIADASAQEPAGDRIRVVLSGGLRIPSRWVDGIERGMIAGNLDGSPCGNVGEIVCSAAPLPHSDEDLPVFGVDVAFRAATPYEVAVNLGFVHAGTVSGYFDGGTTGIDFSDAELTLRTRVTTVAASVRRVLPGRVRVGAGPALHVLRTSGRTVRGEETDTAVTPGMMLEAGVSPSLGRVLFFDLTVRYRWMAAATTGPFNAVNLQGDALTAFPATSARFNALLAELGLGFRL